MSPDSLKHLQRYFSSGSRLRGASYASDGRVRIVKPRDEEGLLRAEVRGSDIYHVTLRDDGTAVDVRCDCPYFENEEEPCKHVWAMLLEAVRLRSFGDLLFREVEYLNDDPADWEVQAPRPAPPLAWYSRVRGRPSPPPVPAWKDLLAGTLRRADYEAIHQTLPSVYELHYTLELHRRRATVDIAIRVPKKSGELSKPRAVTIAIDEIARIPDPADRQILAMLSSGMDEYLEILPSRRQLPRPALEQILPLLVATGRLSVRSGATTVDDTRWNPEPWDLVLSVVSAAADEYALTATLRRGDESIAVADVKTGASVALVGNELSPVADRGASAIIGLIQLGAAPRIPAREGEELLRVLMNASALPHVELPPELAVDFRTADPVPHLRLTKSRYSQEYTAVPTFEYEGIQAEGLTGRYVYDAASRIAIERNLAAESAKLTELTGAGFRRGYGSDLYISSKQLWGALRKVIASGWLVEGSEGAFRSGGELSMSISSGIDWFDLEATARFGSASAAFPDVLDAVRRGDTFVKLDDGSLGLVSDEWRARLEPFVTSASEQKGGALRFRSNQALLIDTLLAGRDDVELDEVFSRVRSRIEELRPTAQDPPAGFGGTLRPYQKEGLGWLTFLRELGFGGCLADDMGLGKTVQVLALLEERRQNPEVPFRPSLVVAPRSLIFNWRSEAARFAPGLRVLEHASPERARTHEDFSAFDLILTTYGTLRRDVALFAAAEFDYVILDEAQAIKNASSLSAKATRLLRGRHRLALTGTPIENHVGELWSLFEFLNPGMLGGSGSRIPSWLKLAGGRGEEAERARSVVARALRPFILRRTKSEVARELPERIEQTIICDLEPKQRAVYDTLREGFRQSLLQRVETDGMGRSKIHVLEALLRLRQAACHPALVDKKYAAAGSAKLDTVVSEVAVLLEEGHKVLVFSQFTSFLALVRAELDEREITYEYLDGRTRDRGEKVRRFQEDESVHLFLISLKAGGLGLNLTAADYVFLLDPWWNPAVEAQAIDRAHRIGQARTVVAYRLVARDTIEEKILQLQNEKRALADAILTEDNSVLRQLTREDLDLLLS